MTLRIFSPNTPLFPHLTRAPVVIDSVIHSSPYINSVTEIVVKYLLKMRCSSLLQHCYISICLDFINIANNASCSIALKGSTTFLPYATSNIVANHYQPLGTNPSQFNPVTLPLTNFTKPDIQRRGLCIDFSQICNQEVQYCVSRIFVVYFPSSVTANFTTVCLCVSIFISCLILHLSA